MPVYEFQGKHYDLPDGLSPEQAKQKIQTHLAGEQSKSVGETVLGGLEGAASVASGLVSAVPQGLRTLGEFAATGDLDTALERSGSSGEAVTFNPRTETGKKVSGSINKTLQDYAEEVASKFAGDQAWLNQQKMNRGTLSQSDMNAENTERFVGDIIGNIWAPGVPLAGLRKGAVKEKAPSKGLDADAMFSEESVPAD